MLITKFFLYTEMEFTVKLPVYEHNTNSLHTKKRVQKHKLNLVDAYLFQYFG